MICYPIESNSVQWVNKRIQERVSHDFRMPFFTKFFNSKHAFKTLLTLPSPAFVYSMHRVDRFLFLLNCVKGNKKMLIGIFLGVMIRHA